MLRPRIEQNRACLQPPFRQHCAGGTVQSVPNIIRTFLQPNRDARSAVPMSMLQIAPDCCIWLVAAPKCSDTVVLCKPTAQGFGQQEGQKALCLTQYVALLQKVNAP